MAKGLHCPRVCVGDGATAEAGAARDPVTERIIGAAVEVHRILGPGLLESICEEALCHEFDLRGIAYERQKPVDVVYKGKVIKGQRLDLLVEGAVVVELKAVRVVDDMARAQVLSYLKATRLRVALLVNFGVKKLTDGMERFVL
jgi:GxxExxY protein